jgi:hypothetical protein
VLPSKKGGQGESLLRAPSTAGSAGWLVRRYWRAPCHHIASACSGLSQQPQIAARALWQYCNRAILQYCNIAILQYCNIAILQNFSAPNAFHSFIPTKPPDSSLYIN